MIRAGRARSTGIACCRWEDDGIRSRNQPWSGIGIWFALLIRLACAIIEANRVKGLYERGQREG